MTAVLTKPHAPTQWGTMPGWNVVADLTPPELINTRFLAVLRRRIVVALVAVVVLCAAGYVYATSQANTASDAADAATSDTLALQHQAAQYAGISQIQASVDGIRAQVAQVMADDVDIPHVIASVRAALPNTMSIQSLTLTITAVAGTAAAAGTTGLDASGQPQIGTITMTGSGRTLDDLPAFVDKLSVIPGVINVLPSSNQVTSGIAQFSVTLTLTDKLYSHRYDMSKTGGN
jgi:type IV pilus assembly protein PilN